MSSNYFVQIWLYFLFLGKTAVDFVLGLEFNFLQNHLKSFSLRKYVNHLVLFNFSYLNRPLVSKTFDISSGAPQSRSFLPLADQREVAKMVDVPGVGRASHLRTGDIWVIYNDSSQILVQSSTTSVVYVSQDGKQEKYARKFVFEVLYPHTVLLARRAIVKTIESVSWISLISKYYQIKVIFYLFYPFILKIGPNNTVRKALCLIACFLASLATSAEAEATATRRATAWNKQRFMFCLLAFLHCLFEAAGAVLMALV